MSASENGQTGGEVELFPRELKRRLDEAQQAYESAQRVRDAAPEMLATLKAHDAYMLDAGFSGPDDEALHPKAAENWRWVRAAISKAEGGAA